VLKRLRQFWRRAWRRLSFHWIGPRNVCDRIPEADALRRACERRGVTLTFAGVEGGYMQITLTFRPGTSAENEAAAKAEIVRRLSDLSERLGRNRFTARDGTLTFQEARR
jgi:hypothetical protein